MSKIKLRDWTQIAEIAGTLGVIISLFFVVHSVNENTKQVSSRISDDSFVALREVRMLAISDPHLLALTVAEKTEIGNFTDIELARYKEWLILHLDEWERLESRRRNGLIEPDNMDGWEEYFRMWFERRVTPEIWEDIKWRHTSGNFRAKRDAEVSGWKPSGSP